MDSNHRMAMHEKLHRDQRKFYHIQVFHSQASNVYQDYCAMIQFPNDITTEITTQQVIIV